MTVPSHSHPILRIECEATVLYAEVIQIVFTRNLYWLRPLALLRQRSYLAEWQQFNESQSEETSTELCDLRQGPDLLIPQQLCQPALDTEVLPLLVQLEGLKDQRERSSDLQQMAQQQLQAFMRQLYQTQPEAFQAVAQP